MLANGACVNRAPSHDEMDQRLRATGLNDGR